MVLACVNKTQNDGAAGAASQETSPSSRATLTWNTQLSTMKDGKRKTYLVLYAVIAGAQRHEIGGL
jgi:hypothetical protein